MAGVFSITLVFSVIYVYFRHNPIKASRVDGWLLSNENRIPMLLLRISIIGVILFAGLVLLKPGILIILENNSFIVRLFPFWGWALLIPIQLTCFWFFEWKRQSFSLPVVLTLVFFISTLLLGLKTYKDYGIAWDEPLQVKIGQTNMRYIRDADKTLLTFKDRYYGPAYELLILRFSDNSDTRQMYLARHIFNFLFFIAGLFAFYWLALHLFASKWFALLSCLCLLLSPRIYADSFYNTKDIPFMVALIFTICTMLLFLNKTSWEFAAIHGWACAFLIAIRVMGIFTLLITWAFLIAKWLFGDRPRKRLGRELLASLIYLTFTLGFVIFIWPILWHNPWGEFNNALNEMSHYPWNNEILYMGRIVRPQQLPWHYIPVWVSISTPLLYLALFILGVISISVYLIHLPGKIYEDKKRSLLIIMACFFGPVLAVILLKSTLYNGWRQMFFIYPSFILIAVQGLRSTIHFTYHRLSPTFIYPALVVLLVIGLSDPARFMARNHPYENMYFNRLAGKNMLQIKQRFEFDYWGLSFKQGIDHLLETDPGQKISIYVTPPGELYVKYLLSHDLQDRLVLKDFPVQARYFVGLYGSVPEEYPYQRKIYSVNLDGASLLSIFDLR